MFAMSNEIVKVVGDNLKRLRADGLMTFRQRGIEIHDIARLREAVSFNPNYLHLDCEGANLHANA